MIRSVCRCVGPPPSNIFPDECSSSLSRNTFRDAENITTGVPASPEEFGGYLRITVGVTKFLFLFSKLTLPGVPTVSFQLETVRPKFPLSLLFYRFSVYCSFKEGLSVMSVPVIVSPRLFMSSTFVNISLKVW